MISCFLINLIYTASLKKCMRTLYAPHALDVKPIRQINAPYAMSSWGNSICWPLKILSPFSIISGQSSHLRSDSKNQALSSLQISITSSSIVRDRKSCIQRHNAPLSCSARDNWCCLEAK